MRYLFLCGLLLAACGGAVDDGAPFPSPANNAPSSVNGGDGCTRSCDRMTKTCAAYEDPRCVESCGRSFDPEEAARFAACIDRLSCEDIRRGVSMDYGPIGRCWEAALQR